MKILLAAKHLHYPQGGGGLERNTHELCLSLLRRGITPGVMCNLRAERSLLVLRNRLATKLRSHLRFPMDRGSGYPVYRGWADDDGAIEVTKRFRPDVVIAQSAEPVPLLKSFKNLGVPRMAYFHETLRVWDAGALIKEGDIGLIANSRFTAEGMAAHAGIVPAVVRPLVDRHLYEVKTRRRNVLFINTVPRKGVEIAFRLAESRPDVPFAFIKSWILSPQNIDKMEKRAREAGNITLYPPTNDMRPHYAKARLVLAPSQWEEAWGRVATEAHINGIPVLASDQGGLREAVGPGGMLVPLAASIQQWKDAFSRLWDDQETYSRFTETASEYSRRPEIQPEKIVDTFIDAVNRHISRSQREQN